MKDIRADDFPEDLGGQLDRKRHDRNQSYNPAKARQILKALGISETTLYGAAGIALKPHEQEAVKTVNNFVAQFDYSQFNASGTEIAENWRVGRGSASMQTQR